ncbi:MAG TPA: PEP-CTERM sorting domain-containing protein, partial [Verrucomicrobiota bacterium]|nr:PEP-CTERM sorting domain-containing protein [Verrucomicrobiota bacterium]
SVDFFASDIASGSAGAGGAQDFSLGNGPLGQPQFASLGTIEFRLFAFGNGTPQGLLEFDNVELVVVVVPEPATPALLLAGAGACWLLRRRRARR